MKTANKTGSAIVYFLISVILSSAAFFSVHYYIPFVEQTAGTYNIVMLSGEPLRDFLIKILLLVSGILAFLTFVVKFRKAPKGKKIYPFYIIALGGLWILLPFLSTYTISRFTGNLIIQTVSSIAIIANVVFMMISVCCGIIAVIDIVHNLFSFSEKEDTANFSAILLAGIPTGCALAFLLSSALQPAIGLSGIFTVLGLMIFIAGTVSLYSHSSV